MAVTQRGRANVAHVNMMTDTIIANLPTDGLRAVLRSLLASHPEITSSLEEEARRYALQSASTKLSAGQPATDIPALKETENLVRCMAGSGLCFESLPLLGQLVTQATHATADDEHFLASVDGDIVQVMTAVQKSLFVPTGTRGMTVDEQTHLQRFNKTLRECEEANQRAKGTHCFSRGAAATASALGVPDATAKEMNESSKQSLQNARPPPEAKETFELGNKTLPRIFSGLWQMSSPAWGAAPTAKILDQFYKHVQGGFNAFDMADHYGDAEIIFGRFWSSYPYRDSVFTATKYCVFHQMTDVTREGVRASVTERCKRLQQDKVDLLQFHWQFYENPRYLDVLRFLAEDDRVGMIGLCNFDTEHMERVLDAGIVFHANQVQFSLIDSRPVFKMGEFCETHKIKLLTYGTLCGGFLSDKWLGKPEPDLYDQAITPSQRKYHTMIRGWGDWTLFQDLLQTLHRIATKHGVSVSNVATRWVLDFPYVGAVIVGARMGISEHTDSNLASFGWSLDKQDQEAIEEVLSRSRRSELFESVGDCGQEYRV